MCRSFFFHFMHLYILAKLSPTGDYGPLWDQGTVVPDPIAYSTLQWNTIGIADSFVLYSIGVHARNCQ